MRPLDRQTTKAARALVEWTAADLANAASISADTIRSFESGRTGFLSSQNNASVVAAFEAEGIQFLDNGDVATGPGVAIKLD